MTVALIYHDLAAAGSLDEHGFPGPAAARYKLTPAAFEAHLDALAATGRRVGLLADGAELVLTFDDGGSSALAAADALEARGWRGHFFITTGRIDTAGFLTADGVRELHARGHGIGSHSHSHPTYMGSLTADRLAEEWRRSRAVLAEVLGTAPASAAVPGGFLSPAVIDEAARAGYELLMTSQPTRRPQRHGDMTVQGRFTVWANTSPDRVAAYAREAPLARASLWLAWQLKTAPKRVSPRGYEAVRQRWAGGHAPR